MASNTDDNHTAPLTAEQTDDTTENGLPIRNRAGADTRLAQLGMASRVSRPAWVSRAECTNLLERVEALLALPENERQADYAARVLEMTDKVIAQHHLSPTQRVSAKAARGRVLLERGDLAAAFHLTEAFDMACDPRHWPAGQNAELIADLCVWLVDAYLLIGDLASAMDVYNRGNLAINGLAGASAAAQARLANVDRTLRKAILSAPATAGPDGDGTQ